MMWQTLLLLVTVWSGPPLTCEGASISYSRAGCEYDGRLHPVGSKFTPDPCTTCHCSREGGVADCVVQDCSREQHCLRYSNSTGSCCPTCLEFGCKNSDGQMFQQGEVIRLEPCVRCYCPFGGGTPVCDVTSCPLSQCVDPIKVEGVCCPVCPNGPNCQIGLLTLPIGQSVFIEGATCTCQTFIDVDGQNRTLARCNKY